MKPIVFIDVEVEPKSKRILDIGAVNHDEEEFHLPSIERFVNFLKGTLFLCGHNILNHDLKYLAKPFKTFGLQIDLVIDTLYLSPLLFPKKPYHALVKDDKLQTDELNNPLNDAMKARDLFHDEVAAFHRLEGYMKTILYLLLASQPEFSGFFRYLDYRPEGQDVGALIHHHFRGLMCENVPLDKIIVAYPIELAYTLALINSRCANSVTPRWVAFNFPFVETLLMNLRSKPCARGCDYCRKAGEPREWLKLYFKYDSFREFDGIPMQEEAVRAAINRQSLLTIFPTGGGKSITFQVPALMSGYTSRSLTVVISPLQSLMKDQVDNLEKLGITQAVTINGLLDPIERAKAFERVEDGGAWLLYISPELLRSKSIERLLLGRHIARFVIDEAHCLSSWGHDFRVDYLYIAQFIKQLQEKKNLAEPIPVSCFTATAKRKVIDDIREYFKQWLSLDLKLFKVSAARRNLRYKVLESDDETAKYNLLRNLIELKNCPTIVYVSRTHKAYTLAKQLTDDGLDARCYHGKMDLADKIENQDAFISDRARIMVATSAFGMGVDKKDVGLVVHYNISDSLENYVQEAGRAGRDENITADCYVLFNDEDLGKHFIMLNQTKLSIKEIQQIWRAIKDLTRFKTTVSNSAFEIARKAGWDDGVAEIETRVKTAIAALEDSGYLRRGQNEPRIFANSIMVKTANEAIERINRSTKFNDRQREQAVRIIKKLISSKSQKQSTDEVGEARIDYISDHLGIVKEEVINVVTLLRDEKILADAKDLTAFLKTGESSNRALQILVAYAGVERFLLSQLAPDEVRVNIKALNEAAETSGCKTVSPLMIKTVFNFWAIKNWLKKSYDDSARNHLTLALTERLELMTERAEKRHLLAKFIINYLFGKTAKPNDGKNEVWVEFSVLELRDAYMRQGGMFTVDVSLADVEDALFYLTKIDALKIEGGFLVVYNRLFIERLEANLKKNYKADDYRRLGQFYEQRVQQIHIVGEYAQKMVKDYHSALRFVDDYFQMEYSLFLNKYFPKNRQAEISKNITPKKFRQVFGTLSPSQLDIINNKDAPHVVVAAGPGSGKTKVLVHKLASLLLMEDVKHEQLLMLTFSRASVTEFKQRLMGLIGNAARFIEIKTFHSYCFDLLGKVGDVEKSGLIVKMATDSIRRGLVEANRITKTVLVIDEAQDMNADEFELVASLMDLNDEMRVIAVGDDDQNIYEFRGADSAYFEQLITQRQAVKFELVANYRSKKNLVDFANLFSQSITRRLKSVPIQAIDQSLGRLRLVRHHQSDLIDAVVQDVKSANATGTTCVMARTNDEALQLCGWLAKKGIHAKLIQSNRGFNLLDMVEVRFFIDKLSVGDGVYVVADEVWDVALNELKKRYGRSSAYEIVARLLVDFEKTNTGKRYKSDFEQFVRESLLEDFASYKGETVVVSTIHRAKGKEFDNVFLMLNEFVPDNDEKRRAVYVALTRAKSCLSIHVNNQCLDRFVVEHMEVVDDRRAYPAPDQLVVQLTHRDVWLDYFESKQYVVSQLHCGDELFFCGDGCTNRQGQSVLKFSRQFQTFIDEQSRKGFSIASAKIDFVLHWNGEKSEKEILIVLPQVVFVKSNLSGPLPLSSA